MPITICNILISGVLQTDHSSNMLLDWSLMNQYQPNNLLTHAVRCKKKKMLNVEIQRNSDLKNLACTLQHY